jgi:hypothetical protein
MFMAYEIHVLRTTGTTDHASAISLEEWESLCANDPSLRLETGVIATNPKTGATITLSELASAVWSSPQTQQEYRFDYRQGRISFVHSDEAIAKAKEIAQAFGARIEGDEGEAY